MTALVIVTFVAIGVLVAALAVYLITIMTILRSVRHTVGLVLFGVRAIAHQAKPVREVVSEMNAELTGVRDALQSLVEKAEAKAPGGGASA